MLYLINKANPQTLFVPKDGAVAAGDLSFTLTSTVENSEPLQAEVSDGGSSNAYYILSVALPEDIADGEYEYVLADDEQPLSVGLLYVGDLPDVVQREYEKTIEYEQYN
jgi:hypothetical protein